MYSTFIYVLKMKYGEFLKKIYALLFLVMLFWGFNVSAVKTLVTYFDPLSLTAIRVFVAGITVLIIAYFMNIFRLPTKVYTKITSSKILLSTIRLLKVATDWIPPTRPRSAQSGAKKSTR